MSNANTIAQAIGPLPGDQMGLGSVAAFYFDDNDATDAIVSLPFDHVKRRAFVVHAYGRTLAAATCNLTVTLDAGESTTISSNTTIGTSGAIALDTDSTVMTWHIEAHLQLGETNSKLQGWYVGHVNNTIGPTVTVATESIEDLVATNKLSFKVSGTLSGSNAANYAILDQLFVDLQ